MAANRQQAMPFAVSKNHSKVPQLGHGPSPIGEGSTQIAARHTGHQFGDPSGVRDGIVAIVLVNHVRQIWYRKQ
jgi:hypothetical protein